MLTSTLLFLLLCIFSLLLLILVFDPIPLSLFFSSGNALVTAAVGMDLLRCTTVFFASFGIFLTAIAMVNLVFKIAEKRRNVKFAQKYDE